MYVPGLTLPFGLQVVHGVTDGARTRDLHLTLRLRFSSFAMSPAQTQSATLVLPGLLWPPGAGSVALPSSSV
jgi:hypothetical protein